MNKEERWKLKEELDDIARLISDIQMALVFREGLDSRNGVVDLIRLGNGETIYTKLGLSDIEAVDKKLDVMISTVRKKVSSITLTQ